MQKTFFRLGWWAQHSFFAEIFIFGPQKGLFS